MISEENNIEVVYRLNELVNNRSYSEMDSLFAEDYIDHNTTWRVKNLIDFKEVIMNAVINFDIKNEIQEVIASGDKVFVHVKNNGEHNSNAFGVEPTGKKTSISTFEIYRFVNNKIVERWVLSDVMSLMRQLEVKLPISF